MIARRMRSLAVLGLLAALLAGAVGTGRTPVAVAAPALPTATVTVHDNWAGMDTVPTELRYQFTRTMHYTLNVTGKHFTPGAQVQMALYDTRSMTVLHRGLTFIQPAFIYRGPYVPNDNAGTFQYTVQFNASLPDTVPLHLWCRAANHMDIHEVMRT